MYSYLTLSNATILERWLVLASLTYKCNTSRKKMIMITWNVNVMISRSPHGACSLTSMHVDPWLMSLSVSFQKPLCLYSLCFVLGPFGSVYTEQDFSCLAGILDHFPYQAISSFILLYWCTRISFIVQIDSYLSCFPSVAVRSCTEQLWWTTICPLPYGWLFPLFPFFLSHTLL